jgi:hypothetical protein
MIEILLVDPGGTGVMGRRIGFWRITGNPFGYPARHKKSAGQRLHAGP